ncbi:MAG: glycosyl hydrolase, partial [Ignavibacteriales bacterium]|nr:glycosyl hydrolase [Ignavibacteriales bacterium]
MTTSLVRIQQDRETWLLYGLRAAAILMLLVGFLVENFAQPAKSTMKYDTTLYNKMQWREIGPFRGGRSVAVAGHPNQMYTFYFGGAGGGGVWKTEDGGNTWINVSDGYLKNGSIGSIGVAESDPNVIYVGTGEACIRGNVAPGDGVYKSEDGGKTWK